MLNVHFLNCAALEWLSSDVLNYPHSYCLNICSRSAAIALSCKKSKVPPPPSLRSFCNLTKEAANNSQSTITFCCPQGYKSLTYREHLLLTICAGCLGSLSTLTATQCLPTEHTHTHTQTRKTSALNCLHMYVTFSQFPQSTTKMFVWSVSVICKRSNFPFMFFFQTPNWAGQETGF